MNDAQVLTNLLSLSPWNVEVGREVVTTLGAMGSRAVPALARFLTGTGAARVPRLAATWLLGRLGGEAAAAALCAAARDRDQEVAAAAAAALTRLGHGPCEQRAAA